MRKKLLLPRLGNENCATGFAVATSIVVMRTKFVPSSVSTYALAPSGLNTTPLATGSSWIGGASAAPVAVENIVRALAEVVPSTVATRSRELSGETASALGSADVVIDANCVRVAASITTTVGLDNHGTM